MKQLENGLSSPTKLQEKHYFVDEAGCGTLFDSKGRVIVGNDGCSSYFMIGMLDVANPQELRDSLEELRVDLLADQYFKKVPSMQPEKGKTAVTFHAKDDIPEVRREVYKLISAFDLKFQAVVKAKQALVRQVKRKNASDPVYRYHPNYLYDDLAGRLFNRNLHKDDKYEVVFSDRGAKPRTEALREAIETARDKYCRKYLITVKPPIIIKSLLNKKDPCLQATDYFLWSLQRLYERNEDRYIEYLWPKFKVVHDIDDTRRAGYGVYYTQKNPLTLAGLFKPGI